MRARTLTACAAAAAMATPLAGATAPNQPVHGPVAVYWMSASTVSGMGGMMGAMGGGGGRRPGLGAMMGMAMGNGPDPNAASHSLVLQLGSERRPQGEPTAEHDPPEALGAGPVLPLETPQPQQPPTYEEHQPGPPPQYQKPQGRMLIFWGCGEHAPPGQPLVIDFANMTDPQRMQQFEAMSRGLAVTPMQPPSPTRNATYGEWPNKDTRTSVPPEGSLQGPHVIKGNYTPDIDFTLSANQDFLPPIQLTTNQKNPSGSATLAWRPVDGAQGYVATMFGAGGEHGQGGGAQIVMWTSSQIQVSAFSLPDYLSNGEIARLVENHALMPASATQCVIPQEAVQAAGQAGFFRMVAYGGESNISYPPRPPAPQPWNILWEVKLRYRAETSGMVGVDMSAMGGRHGQGQQGQPGQQQQPQQRPSLFHGLGSFIP